MKPTMGLLLASMAFALAQRATPPAPPETPLQLADMGMGPAGPQLGGSQDDMVLDDPGHLSPEPDMVLDDPGHIPPEAQMELDDPGHLPRAPDMVLTNPGHVPPEAEMDIEQPQDLDQQDDITE
ncbi:MAG: hypothetical protein AB1689_00580 [Thermodesulfobacteriota bacterium]